MISATKSKDVFFEDGCRADATPGGSDKICRSRGGESCAFDGAMIVLQPIADTLHIVHGPSACAGNSWEGRGTRSSKGYFHKMGFTTDISEMDIVYGAEDKLYRAILKAFDAMKPKAIFVYATCVSGINGEDIEAVCRKAGEVLPVRVIAVNAPGFVGPKNLGNRIAGDVLLNQVIGTGEPPKPLTGREVNLIGEYNIAGDLWQVEPALKKAGIEILSRITGDGTFEEITYAHRAKLNVLVCSRALINVARGMERAFGIPFVEVSFYGKTEMDNAIRSITGKFDLSAHPQMAQDAINVYHERLGRCLQRYAHLRGKRAVLYSGGVKSWSIISALMDLGMEIAAVGTKKSTYEDEEKMRKLLGADAPLIEDVTPKNLLRLIRDRGAHVLVAGGRNLYLGVKEGIPFVDVNQERHRAYAGYEGLVNLAEDISQALAFYGSGLHSGVTKNAAVKSAEPVKSAGLKAPQAPHVRINDADLVVNPLRHSPSIGAAIAFQGIDGALPVIHGAQGCTFLSKVLITKHYREPIALAGTKLFAGDVIMGSDENLAKTVEESLFKQSPEVIAVLSSGLTETKGDDIEGAVARLREKYARKSSSASSASHTMIIYVPTPDYQGGLEEGYAGALEALVEAVYEYSENATQSASQQSASQRSGFAEFAVEEKCPYQKRVNIFAGHHLAPQDFSWLRDTSEAFGLKPILLPDLAALDGSRQGVSPLAVGGTTVREMMDIPRSVHSIVIGPGLQRCAAIVRERSGVDYTVLNGVTGMRDSGAFVEVLSKLSGTTAPKRLIRERAILLDGMRDAQFYFGGRRVCLALEAGACISISRLLTEMGARVTLAAVPVASPYAGLIEAESVAIGDLYSISASSASMNAETEPFDLLVSNSHAVDTAAGLGVPLYQFGFPAYKTIGINSRLTCGYGGSLHLINAMANLMAGDNETPNEALKEAHR